MAQPSVEALDNRRRTQLRALAKAIREDAEKLRREILGLQEGSPRAPILSAHARGLKEAAERIDRLHEAWEREAE